MRATFMMKRIVNSWRLVVAVGVIIGIAAGVKTLFFDQTDDVYETQGNIQADRIREAKDVEELQAANMVRSLRATEEGATLSTLPNGVYGYVTGGFIGWGLEYDRFDELKLKKSAAGIHYVELHKSSGGEILVIVYAIEGDVTRLTDPTRDQAVEMFVLYRSDGEYENLVAIPVSRLLSWDDRSGDELGEFAKIGVR